MPLLGSAAMLLCFDVAAEAVHEHDRWHTHEHLPERLSIPGFLRGTRWTAWQGQPRYLVLYEVESLETLTSAAYLDRLDRPTPWTTRMMPHYRGMTRGLCSVIGSRGSGMGHFGLLSRFRPAPGAGPALDHWIVQELLPVLPTRPGLGSAHLLQGALAPPMTREQRMRGSDAGVDRALLVTGYGEDVLAELAQDELGCSRWQERGAREPIVALYRTDYTLTGREIDA